MKLNDLKLRCYAEPDKDGVWFAICIDLNLYARADSPAAVRQKLHDIIHQYITEAVTDDAQHINDLIPRHAPWHFILRYHFIACIIGCRRAKEYVSSPSCFWESMPLKPA